jgi:osmotically inducible protein OsmC
MAVRKAHAQWQGDLKKGKGTIELAGSGWKSPYGFSSRFEEGSGTNPEELIAGAHAGCFSMAFAHALSEAGHAPDRVQTTAAVHLAREGDGFVIPKIELTMEAEVPGIDEETFQRIADDAKRNCPVSKVLASAEITLRAKLVAKNA